VKCDDLGIVAGMVCSLLESIGRDNLIVDGKKVPIGVFAVRIDSLALVAPFSFSFQFSATSFCAGLAAAVAAATVRSIGIAAVDQRGSAAFSSLCYFPSVLEGV
jgi:riboflavin transporter FmnP